MVADCGGAPGDLHVQRLVSAAVALHQPVQQVDPFSFGVRGWQLDGVQAADQAFDMLFQPEQPL